MPLRRAQRQDHSEGEPTSLPTLGPDCDVEIHGRRGRRRSAQEVSRGAGPAAEGYQGVSATAQAVCCLRVGLQRR